MMFYQRTVFPALLDHLAKKQITVLTGMRRTGKTTLLKALMERSPLAQKVYFDLERIDNREFFAEKNYENIVYALSQRGFDLEQPLLIAIDEIQMAPNLPSVVKYLYDTCGFKFILTGSSAYYLRNTFNESLAGRKKLFEIHPLTFGELLTFNGILFEPLADWQELRFVKSEYERLKAFYEMYVQFGGFPEVVLAESEADKKDLIGDILSSYINYDIAVLADIRKSTELYKLVRLLS
uniref:ATP-binding protein n=1 Tax=Persicitalea sp. TaxID=3100273 RepID=UPI003593060E